MKNRRPRAPDWVRLGVVLGLPHAVIGTAAAADAVVPATVSENIVVTAEFRERTLQDTPLAITVVGAPLIEARGQTDLAAVAAQAPNVVLKVLGGSYGPALAASIRGVGVFDFNPALEPGVGLYVDDVYYPTLTGADLALLDLDRIEILRGPQGTLIGRNAIGGAIKLVTRRPDGTNNAFLEATYGSAQRMGLRGAAGFGITDSLSARLAGVVEKQDGYVERLDYGCVFPSGGIPATRPAGECRAGLDGGVGYAAIRGSLRYFQPGGRLDAIVSADFTRDDRTPAGEVLTYANLNNANVNPAPGIAFDSRFICGEYCNYSANAQPAAGFVSAGPFNGYPLNATSGSDQTTFEGTGVSAHVNFALTPNLSLQSITAYREYESTFNSDDDLSPANAGFGQNRLDHHFFSQEFRLNGQAGERVAYTIGAYASTQKTTYFSYQDVRYAPIPLQFVGNDPVNAETQAVFATAIWSATNALNVTVGARYTHENKDYTFSRLNLDGTPNPFLGALTGTVGEHEGDHVDYRASLDYRWTENLMTYATISTGFRGGGIGPRPFNIAQVQPFDIEELTNYEIGTKTDLFQGRLNLNVAAFYNDYTGLQLTLNSCPQFGGPGPCALPQNAGDARVMGVELEASAFITEAFVVDGSVSFIDFEYTRIETATGLSDAYTRPYLPEWKWSLGAQYTFDLGMTGFLTARIDAAYQDSVYTNAVNRELNLIPEYTVVNARISWMNANRDLEVAVLATNLLDEYYFLTKFDLALAGAGAVKSQPGRPREVALTIRKTF